MARAINAIIFVTATLFIQASLQAPIGPRESEMRQFVVAGQWYSYGSRIAAGWFEDVKDRLAAYMALNANPTGENQVGNPRSTPSAPPCVRSYNNRKAVQGEVDSGCSHRMQAPRESKMRPFVVAGQWYSYVRGIAASWFEDVKDRLAAYMALNANPTGENQVGNPRSTPSAPPCVRSYNNRKAVQGGVNTSHDAARFLNYIVKNPLMAQATTVLIGVYLFFYFTMM